MHLCIYVSMHLCIYASMHLCIYVSMYLCLCESRGPVVGDDGKLPEVLVPESVEVSGRRLGIIGWEVQRGNRSRCCACFNSGIIPGDCKIADGNLKLWARVKRGQLEKSVHATVACVRKLGTNMLNIEGRENSISYLQQESSEGGARARGVVSRFRPRARRQREQQQRRCGMSSGIVGRFSSPCCATAVGHRDDAT